MMWLVAIGLALAAFAVAVVVFRLNKITWASLGAALLLGLAGYTLQASPDLPGAPAAQSQQAYQDEWQMFDSRRLLVGTALRSHSNLLVTADAFATRGQFENAAGFLRGALAQDPRDFEVWLALGNVLTEQADGALTQASVYAYREASVLAPGNPAPGYFLGLALIRQGRMMEARGTWASALEQMGPEATDEATEPHAFMVERVGRLETMLGQIQNAQPAAQPGAEPQP
jgi:cytochrome c-type biogenesis protein CcmH